MGRSVEEDIPHLRLNWFQLCLSRVKLCVQVISKWSSADAQDLMLYDPFKLDITDLSVSTPKLAVKFLQKDTS